MAKDIRALAEDDAPAVRWPFRVGAGLIGAAVLVVLCEPAGRAVESGDLRRLLLLGLTVLVLAGPYLWVAAGGAPSSRRLERRVRAFTASLAPMITITASPERFTFASGRRAAIIDTALRVAPDGRILGFGESERKSDGEVLRLFCPDESGVNERALGAFCRRGLASALGPWGVVRPRVVVRGVSGVRVSPEALARVLLAAGAATVEFAD